MTRGNSSELIQEDPEIERTLRNFRHTQRQRAESDRIRQFEMEQNMGEEIQAAAAAGQPRTMSDYARPNLMGAESSILRPTVAANNFEIKPNVIQMVQQFIQFDGMQDEDPNAHLANFLEICDTFKINGASNDAIRLRLFPFSLRGRAKQWLNSLPRGSITTWDQMAEKFLLKYFPPAKTAKLRNDISSYAQIESESLYDTWERFKELLRRCPHHGLPTWLQVQTFYNGLNHGTRQMIDAAAGGTLNSKTPEAAQDLIEEMAMNNYQWHTVRSKPTKPAGVYDVDAVTGLAIQLDALSKKIEGLSMVQQPAQVACCEICGGRHISRECTETVNYMGNAPHSQNNPHSNTYNQGWRNQNLTWGGQGHQRQTYPLGYQQQQPAPEKKSNLEELMGKFIEASEKRFTHIETTLMSQGTSIRSIEASFHTLENQVGQMAEMLSARQPGSLPSNTERNPKEQVHAIFVGEVDHLDVRADGVLIEATENSEEMKTNVLEPKQVLREYKPRLPYPPSLYRRKAAREVADQSQPVTELKCQALNLAEKLEPPMINLDEESSTTQKSELPAKLKDPGSFFIPLTIGS